MKIKTGWYEGDYYVVKPLHNGCRQELIMHTMNTGCGRYYIAAGIFSCNTTYESLQNSPAWEEPTSTNKNPSFKVIPLALEALREIEEEIVKNSNGKRRFIYIDGFDERRLRVYTKVLIRYNCGYKKSPTLKGYYCDLPLLYKQL